MAELAWQAASSSSRLPPWVAVDQEGGRVPRFKAPLTSGRRWRARPQRRCRRWPRRFASALAAELRAIGITLDFAPVLDVFTRTENPAIGDRALSSDAALCRRSAWR